MPLIIGNNIENNHKITNNFNIINNNFKLKHNIKNSINIINNNENESTIFNVSYDNINNNKNILSKIDNISYVIELKNAYFDTKIFMQIIAYID